MKKLAIASTAVCVLGLVLGALIANRHKNSLRAALPNTPLAPASGERGEDGR